MKIADRIKEALKPYNGKVQGHNAEAGDTSWDNDHYHKTMIDAEGNGETTITLPKETKPKDKHVHKIVNWEIQGINGHTHTLIS